MYLYTNPDRTNFNSKVQTPAGARQEARYQWLWQVWFKFNSIQKPPTWKLEESKAHMSSNSYLTDLAIEEFCWGSRMGEGGEGIIYSKLWYIYNIEHDMHRRLTKEEDSLLIKAINKPNFSNIKILPSRMKTACSPVRQAFYEFKTIPS